MNKVKDDGYFVLIEYGSPKGFRFINDFRNIVRDEDYEGNIFAPCPHAFNCPVAERSGTWCHFSQFTSRFDKQTFPKSPLQR